MDIAEKLVKIAENAQADKTSIKNKDNKITELNLENLHLTTLDDRAKSEATQLLQEQDGYIGDSCEIISSDEAFYSIEKARQRNPLVYEAGKTSEYDRFWDNYQNNGERKNYNYAFQSPCWTDETYKPKHSIVASSATNLYVSNKNITDTQVTIDLSGAFINNTFSYSGLKTIRKIIVNEKTTHAKDTTGATNGFNGIYDLAEVTFSGVWMCGDLNIGYSHYLSKASIISIFNVLSEDVEGLTLEISRQAVNNAFGIDVDDDTTFPEGSEYYNLRWSKGNWHVNYIG